MNWARLFFGSLIAALGTILLLEYADVLDAGRVISMWWPAVIVLVGFLSYLANPRHWLFPAVLAVGGGALLLRTTDVVDTWAIIGPSLLILVGVFVMLGRGFGARTVADGNRISTFNVFSGSEVASHSPHFEGGTVGTLFGGAEIDLRDAELAPGASLDVFAAFGGAEIKVPQGWNVTIGGLPIFGGFENITAKEAVGVGAPTLAINATVLFGGLEVKH